MNYEGRPWDYENGINCFHVIEEWYLNEMGLNIGETWNKFLSNPDIDTAWNWWERVPTSYYELCAESAGFVEVLFNPLVNNLQYGDQILFCLKSSIANHSGVYCAENKILHHLAFGESSIDDFSIGSVLWKRVYKVFRHQTQFV